MEVFYENKVQDLTNLCFLCLTCDKKRTVHNYNYQKIQEELISIFPEQMVNMSKVPKHVCSKCTKNLNNCYNFRKKCIKNINSFNELAQKLIQKSDSIVSNEIHNNVESTNTEPPHCNKTIDTSIIKYEPDETCSVDSYTDPLMINCGESTYSDFYSTLVKMEETEDNDNIKQNIEEIVWVKNEIKDEIEVPNVTENLPDTFENVSLDYNVRKTNSEDITLGPSTKRKKVDIKSNDMTISTEHNLHVDRTQSTSDNQSSIWISFCSPQLTVFLKTAAKKVALIIGISGACRSDELFKMKISDVEMTEKRVIIIIPDTKTDRPRSFVITDPKLIAIVQEYINLRKSVENQRFFMQIRHGRVTRQPYGHNAIGLFPKKIAMFLNLNDVDKFTGHCFRRTAATLLANTGGDILQLKKVT